MRWIPVLVCSMALLGAIPSAQAQSTPAQSAKSGHKPTRPKSAPAKAPQARAAAAKAPASLLPDSFSGWVTSDAPKALTDPAQADSANVAALKEYGFTQGAQAVYKRSGETLTVRALRFEDASGAYGAYTFYRQSGLPKEQIGSGAASDHNRVLFWLGNTFVDATFSKIGPMSGSELRDLASQITVPEGNKAIAPPVLANLPKDSLDGQTTHYALGPAGYAGAGGVLPPSLVGFDRGAETVTAGYTLRSGPATLTIVDYPTPQMAAAQEKLIRDYIKAGNQKQNPWPKPLADSDTASLEVRRSGPLVALVSGDAVPDESHKLLATVYFTAEVISVPQPMQSEVSKTAKLLLGIAMLVIIVGSAAVLLGLFLGGGRAIWRVAHGKPASSVYEAEFTSLNLRE